MPQQSFPLSGQAADEQALSWRRAAAELGLTCAGSYATDEPARLRELATLLDTCPPDCAIGLSLPDPARLEQILAANAAAAAALALFDNAQAGYLLSRGPGGSHLASVIMPGSADEVSAGGETVALALIGALALGLADLDRPAAPKGEGRAPNGMRFN